MRHSTRRGESILPPRRSSGVPRSRRPDARRDCQTQPDGPSESALWGAACWNVPYGLLGVAEGPAARNGPERLNCIFRGWPDACWMSMGSPAGHSLLSNPGAASATAIVSDRQIRIGRGHALESNEEEIRDTVFGDEIATRDRGARRRPWDAVEGDGAANRTSPRRGRRCTMTNRAEPGTHIHPGHDHVRSRTPTGAALTLQRPGACWISSRLPKRVL